MHRLAVVLLVISAGCSFNLPRVSHVPVQQGNVITQAMMDRLKPGMTRRQVAFVMGEPVLRDTFDADRWDYVHSYQIGRTSYQQTLVTLHFQDDVLTSITGDMAPSAATTPESTPAPADNEFNPPEYDPIINDTPTS